MTLDDVLDDRKSKAGTTGFAASSSVDTIETLGHTWEVLARDARAVIGHRDRDCLPSEARVISIVESGLSQP